MQVDYMHVYISQMGRFKRQLLCFKTTPPHGKMNGWVPWSTNLKAMLLMVNAWSAYLLTGEMTCMEAKKAWPLGVAFKGWMARRRQLDDFQHIISLENRVKPSIKNWLFRVPGGYHGNHLFFLGRIIFGGKVTKEKQHKRMIEVAQSFQGCDQTCLDLFEVIFHGFLTIVCHH